MPESFKQLDIFKGEDQSVADDMVKLILHNKFKDTGDLSEFQYVKFEDLCFDVHDLEVKSKHKALFRKLIGRANASPVNAEEEDGEVTAPDKRLAEERLQIFSEIMETAAKKSKKQVVHVKTAEELTKHCGNVGKVCLSYFYDCNA